MFGEKALFIYCFCEDYDFGEKDENIVRGDGKFIKFINLFLEN